MNVEEARESMNEFGHKVRQLIKEYGIKYFVSSFEIEVDSEEDVAPPVVACSLQSGDIGHRFLLIGQLLGQARAETYKIIENKELNGMQTALKLGQTRGTLEEIGEA